jgi:hypothetical protein
VPVFVKVTTCAELVVAVCCTANVSALELKLAAPWTPVADMLTDLVPACVPMLNVPLRAAVLLGVKVTVTVQVAPTANEVPQVVLLKLKSWPLTDAADGGVTLKVPMPVLRRVAAAELEAPTAVVPKLSEVRLALGTCPVPPSSTLAKPPPLCTKLNVPVRAPAALGVKETRT